MNDNGVWPPSPWAEPTPYPDIVLYPARWKMALIALGGLLFVLCAPLLWATGDPFIRVVAVADVLFFGFCALFALGRLLRPRPSLVIDERGITDNASATGAGFIAWDEIAAVGMSSMGANRFLVIIPHDTEAILARQPSFKRKIMVANMGLLGSPVAIPGHTTMPLEEIMRHVQARLAEA
ncbi:MAG: STM3941 family protein [Janthinobacterium lividum]